MDTILVIVTVMYIVKMLAMTVHVIVIILLQDAHVKARQFVKIIVMIVVVKVCALTTVIIVKVNLFAQIFVMIVEVNLFAQIFAIIVAAKVYVHVMGIKNFMLCML